MKRLQIDEHVVLLIVVVHVKVVSIRLPPKHTHTHTHTSRYSCHRGPIPRTYLADDIQLQPPNSNMALYKFRIIINIIIIICDGH